MNKIKLYNKFRKPDKNTTINVNLLKWVMWPNSYENGTVCCATYLWTTENCKLWIHKGRWSSCPLSHFLVNMTVCDSPPCVRLAWVCVCSWLLCGPSSGQRPYHILAPSCLQQKFIYYTNRMRIVKRVLKLTIIMPSCLV